MGQCTIFSGNSKTRTFGATRIIMVKMEITILMTLSLDSPSWKESVWSMDSHKLKMRLLLTTMLIFAMFIMCLQDLAFTLQSQLLMTANMCLKTQEFVDSSQLSILTVRSMFCLITVVIQLTILLTRIYMECIQVEIIPAPMEKTTMSRESTKTTVLMPTLPNLL